MSVIPRCPRCKLIIEHVVKAAMERAQIEQIAPGNSEAMEIALRLVQQSPVLRASQSDIEIAAHIRADERSKEWRLTEKENQTVHLLITGMRNKGIAEILGTSEQVIKNRLVQIYDKAGAGDRLELVTMILFSPPVGLSSSAGAPA